MDEKAKSVTIGEMRSEMGLTIEAFAELAGVHQRTVIRWEQREVVPRKSTLQPILEAYHTWKAGGRDGRAADHGVQHATGRLVEFPSQRIIRFGVCCEFWDTTFPVLCDDSVTGTFSKYQLPRIQFFPVPWDDRALAALSDLLDVLVYNEYCAYEFKKSEPRHANYVIDKQHEYRSGQFYIALRSAGANQLSIKAALKSIFDEASTTLVVPSADFEVKLKLMAKAWYQESWSVMEDQFHRRLRRVPAGTGARIVAEWDANNGDNGIAYVGGQDQRTYLEQERAGDPGFRVLQEEDIKKVLRFEIPESLSTNRLILANSDLMYFVPRIASAIKEALELVASSDHAQTEAHQAIARWHHLYNTRFFGLPYDEVERDVTDLVRNRFGSVVDYSETAGKSKLKLFTDAG